MNPLLSVIIPNYNHARYLERCLKRVLSEAPPNSEILVIDDCSTDNSVEILNTIQKTDPRLKIYKNSKNRGVNETVNYGLQIMEGELFFGLAADDLILPGFFNKILSVFQDHPHIHLCCSDYAYFYGEDESAISTNKLLQNVSVPLISNPQKTLDLFRKTDFWIPGHTTIARAETMRRYGGYKKEVHHFSDFYLLHKIALTQPIAYIPQSLSAMRIIPNSFSAQCFNNRSIRNEASRNLLELVSKDECKTLFLRSTVLRLALKPYFYKAIFQPKYWKYYLPVIWKKAKKTLMTSCGFRMQ